MEGDDSLEDYLAKVQAENALATAQKQVESNAASVSQDLSEKEIPKFKKEVLSKGDKTNFPKKGDSVSVW